jgi:MFS family permease
MRPRSFYGWRITWTLAITQTIGYGVLYYAFSVFIRPMEAELGWSRAQTSGAFSVALLFSGIAAVPVGYWLDWRGARGLMTAGSIAGVLLVMAWSFVGDLRTFYVVQAGIGLVMAAVFYEVAFTVVAVWFRRDRARAMLVLTMVAGLASTIFIPLASWLVAVLPWRDALRVLALVLAVGTVPLHALVLRRRPEDLGLEPDGSAYDESRVSVRAEEPTVKAREALLGTTFWWISVAFALSKLTIVAIGAHAVPLLSERGYAPALVAAAAGSIGLMQVMGRLLFTPFHGRVPLPVLTAFVFGVHATSLLTLLLVPSVLGVWVFAALLGAGNGALTLARAGLIAEVFGAAHYGSINGNMALIIALVQAVAPLGAGMLRDASGSYTLVLWFLLAGSVLGALCVLQVRSQEQ